MPELPEVETVARGLRASLVGRTIGGATVRWPRTIATHTPAAFERQIAGRSVVSVGRRGKYVVLTLDEGYLLIHLKMSGRLRVVPAGEAQDKHTHTLFDLDDGRQLRFRDVRKFGRVHLVAEMEEVTGHLGPEPLADDFDLERFRRLLARRSGRLKSLLLNQTFLAGLGNIYADESLFAAGLDPRRKADSLTADEEARLYSAIRRVLQEAVSRRGTTLDDGGYRDAEGEAGRFQSEIAVYGRRGEPCFKCGTAIERIVLGGRSTHFCPHCQPSG
ncbi:MAG: bifunctional DNA-formamidopyrimidine glycosylase/DNA-(apurinic or apyrimidinic site) lyase [Anaerolineae bacterium]